MRQTAFSLLLALCAALALLSLSAGAEGTRVYLNDTTPYTLSILQQKTFSLSSNLTLSQRINHTFSFVILSTISNSQLDIQYQSSANLSGFLLRFRIRNLAGTNDDAILQPFCNDTSDATFNNNPKCGPGCGGLNFGDFNTFRVEFNSSTEKGYLFINDVLRTQLDLCTNINSIDYISFFSNNGGGSDENISANLLVANNLPPVLISNLSNLTWDEDSSTSFNISASFSDPNNDALRYNFTSAANLSISINNATGIVNITPDANYFGSQLVQFFAFDGDSFTGSNEINLTVLGINDAPVVSGIILSSTDGSNQSNGTLQASWSYSDVENDTQSANETKWYLNGTEEAGFRNLTMLLTNQTNKTQNWSFSVRVSDGQNFSAFANSTPLLIVNTPPAHNAPIITSTDSQSRLNGTLSCANQSAADEDNDTLSSFAQWHKNRESIPAANSLTLNAGNYSKRDNLTCELSLFDGEANSTRLNSTFTIANAAPILNSTIPDKSWSQDSSLTFNLSAHFLDIDNDNLSYEFSAVSSITISIDNATGIATLAPDAGFSGSGSVAFSASDGEANTSSNNLTLTVNAAPSSSSTPSSSSSGGGGGGGAGYICRLDWQCSEWSACEDGKQERKCKLADVTPFASLDSCPQSIIPEQEKDCKASAEKPAETCSDGVKNQDEEGTDCGGICAPCPVVQEPSTQQQGEVPAITGAAVGAGAGKAPWVWALLLTIAALGIFIYAKYGKRFLRKEVSQEEINKLLNEPAPDEKNKPSQP